MLVAEPSVSRSTLATDFDLHVYITQFIERFNRLVFSPGFGFDGYKLDELMRYLSEPKQFALSLKRERGKSILYGLPHARCRRSFFNGLAEEMRVQLLVEKMEAQGILPFLESELGWSWSSLQSVEDIGMGHSVYLLGFDDGERKASYVLKRQSQDFQRFFCQVLDSVDWISFRSRCFETAHGSWELSDYLGAQYLTLQRLEQGQSKELEKRLAKHAALGDVMGLGDRHFENYVIYKNDILSLDVSYLFWPDNESWTERYIAGGVYEISILQKYILHPERLAMQWRQFWSVYEQALDELSGKKDLLYEEINSFFSKDDALRYHAFLSSRLEDAALYADMQKQRYREAFLEMLQRRIYKDMLQRLLQTVRDRVYADDLLKMYVLSDEDRLSSFLHIEDFGDDVFRRIELLAKQVFSLGSGYFDDAIASVQALRRVLS